jgi:hypothetical protein
MAVAVQLPEALAHRLQKLALEEGTSLDGLIRRLVTEHLERPKTASGHQGSERSAPRKEVRFPLIPKEETGVIFPFTGADLDEMFARDDFPS